MKNGEWFRWVVGGLIASLLIITGYILVNFNDRIASVQAAQSITITETAVIKNNLEYIKQKVDQIEQRLR